MSAPAAPRQMGYALTALLAITLAACSRADVPPASPAAVTAPAATFTPQPAAITFGAETACTVATPCAEEPAATAAADSAQLEAIDARLAALYDGAPFRGAVLAARQGEVIVSRGYGLADTDAATANTPQTRFRLGSITKPITALALLMLQAAGRVDVSQPVCAYLPECPAAWARITLHHLLSHTSGIPDFTRFADFTSTSSQPTTPADTLVRFADHPLDFAPGTAWGYSNSNYIVLGVVIEQVTGQPYASYVQEAIFAPLGMDDSGYDTMEEGLAVGYRPDGRAAEFVHMSIPFAAGGLYSTVEDLYTLDRALVAGDLLPDDLRAQMWTAHAAIPGPGPEQGYGYGWVIAEGPQGKVVSHHGSIEGFSAGLRHYLEPDVLIVALSNEEQRSPDLVLDALAEMILP